ncbi:MAG: TonB family protein [Bacteroidaceae bacterium]|nr:TonB family protein [Bacteroidaceae bacterium]
MKLIETALGARFNSIANNFTHCSTKKRILMMMKKQTSPWARLKVLYVLPVAALVLLAASCDNPKEEADAQKTSEVMSVKAEAVPLYVVDGNVVSAEEFKNLNPDDIESMEVLKGEAATSQWGSRGENGAVVATTKKAASKAADEPADAELEVFNVVEKMPEFEGGVQNLLKFLKANITYPEEAKKNGTQGRVVVQFVVDKDGSITDAKIVKSVSPELDAEALRVVKIMPKWTPGEQKGEKVRVKFTLPVQFKLPD